MIETYVSKIRKKKITVSIKQDQFQNATWKLLEIFRESFNFYSYGQPAPVSVGQMSSWSAHPFKFIHELGHSHNSVHPAVVSLHLNHFNPYEISKRKIKSKHKAEFTTRMSVRDLNKLYVVFTEWKYNVISYVSLSLLKQGCLKLEQQWVIKKLDNFERLFLLYTLLATFILINK